MKYILLIISVLTISLSCETGSANAISDNQTKSPATQASENTLIILSSPNLYPLTSNWVKEFTRLNPSVKITVNDITNKQNEAGNSLSFISNEYSDAVNDATKWMMVVGHDAIVPVINAKNPMLTEICRQGISAQVFSTIFSDPDKMNWATIINCGQNTTAHIYMIDNESDKSSIANFAKINPSSIKAIRLSTSEELISAVKNDLFGIGFCKLKDIRKPNTNEFADNIMLLPIDKNSNGRIDNFENIYKTPDSFSRGVWVGKYPNALCGSIYAISKVKPTDKNAVEFLTWILADGGTLLNANGYNDLASIEKQSNMNILLTREVNSSEISNATTSTASFLWVIILMVIVVAGVIITAGISLLKRVKPAASYADVKIIPVLNESVIGAPQGLYFDKTHTWAFMEKDGIVRVGIDDFLQHITGTLTKIKMKEPGEKVRKGEEILTIMRNGKQLKIYSPVSGIIREQNRHLLSDSSIMNSSPYTEGWVYMLEPKNWIREIEFLFMGDKYKEWLKDEFKRLKDFFTVSLVSENLLLKPLILQDGGELTDNVLADLSPEVWENFQTGFIDISR